MSRLRDFGDTVPLGITTRDANGTVANATTVTLTITLPDGTTVTPLVTNPPATTGQYVYDYTTTQAGHYAVRWSAVFAGGFTDNYTDAFDVDSATPVMLFSLKEAKEFLNIEDSTDDEELRQAIASVTAVVEAEVGPCVRRTVTTTIYPTGNIYKPVVLPDTHILSLTSAATVTGTTIDTTGWIAEDGVIRSAGTVYPYSLAMPWTPWTITYVVGRAVIPPNVIQAAKEILKLAWAAQRGPAGELPAFLISYRAAALLQPDREYTGFA